MKVDPNVKLTITIPAEHYVGYKTHRRGEKGEEKYLLAFATPNGDDKAANKRKETVNHWMDQEKTWNWEYEKDADGHYIHGTQKRVETYNRDYKAPDILKNELQEGFELSEDIKRHGWNGGNVVWRVADPRGFELEISSANLAQILSCTSIDKGKIPGRCIWGRDGAVNVLLPECSQPYQAAMANTARKTKSKIKIKDITPGSTVTFKNGKVGVYLGQWYVNSLTQKDIKGEKRDSWRSYETTIAMEHTFSSVARHLFVLNEMDKAQTTEVRIVRTLDIVEINEAKTVAYDVPAIMELCKKPRAQSWRRPLDLPWSEHFVSITAEKVTNVKYVAIPYDPVTFQPTSRYKGYRAIHNHYILNATQDSWLVQQDGYGAGAGAHNDRWVTASLTDNMFRHGWYADAMLGDRTPSFVVGVEIDGVAFPVTRT